MFVKSLISLFLILMSQSVFAQSEPLVGTWARFTCYLDQGYSAGIDKDKHIIFDVGQPEEGWPLNALWLNNVESKALVSQYQFELKPVDYSVDGRMVWVEKIAAVPDSQRTDFNRILSIAKIETSVTVASGAESRTYKVTKVSTNVDAAIPTQSRITMTYKCLEPEVF